MIRRYVWSLVPALLFPNGRRWAVRLCCVQPENVLLGRDGHLCLTDFGLAKELTLSHEEEDGDGKAKTICGTNEYMVRGMALQTRPLAAASHPFMT